MSLLPALSIAEVFRGQPDIFHDVIKKSVPVFGGMIEGWLFSDLVVWRPLPSRCH